MKRYILTLILTIIATFCIAQHLTFMGIPMGKKIVDFKSQLASKGFKTVDQNNNTYRMVGYFNGFNTTVDIETTPKTKLVYRVAVIFNDYIINTKDDEITKTSQMSTYYKFRSQLIQKYGICEDVDGNMPLIVSCKWEKNNGIIMLSVDSINPSYRILMVVYNDTKTYDVRQLESKSDW